MKNLLTFFNIEKQFLDESQRSVTISAPRLVDSNFHGRFIKCIPHPSYLNWLTISTTELVLSQELGRDNIISIYPVFRKNIYDGRFLQKHKLFLKISKYDICNNDNYFEDFEFLNLSYTQTFSCNKFIANKLSLNKLFQYFLHYCNNNFENNVIFKGSGLLIETFIKNKKDNNYFKFNTIFDLGNSNKYLRIDSSFYKRLSKFGIDATIAYYWNRDPGCPISYRSSVKNINRYYPTFKYNKFLEERLDFIGRGILISDFVNYTGNFINILRLNTDLKKLAAFCKIFFPTEMDPYFYNTALNLKILRLLTFKSEYPKAHINSKELYKLMVPKKTKFNFSKEFINYVNREY